MHFESFWQCSKEFITAYHVSRLLHMPITKYDNKHKSYNFASTARKQVMQRYRHGKQTQRLALVHDSDLKHTDLWIGCLMRDWYNGRRISTIEVMSLSRLSCLSASCKAWAIMTQSYVKICVSSSLNQYTPLCVSRSKSKNSPAV